MGADDATASFLSVVQRGRNFSGYERHCCFLNLHDGSFADVSSLSGLDLADDGRGAALSDWDGDGDLDVFVSNRSGPQLKYFENGSARAGQSVAVRLQGTTANRDAIGARVELVCDGIDQPQVRTLRAGDGFLSQSTKWVHFGLEDGAGRGRLRVRWPGGSEEEFAGFSPGGRYQLVEGSGRAAPVEGRPQVKAGPAPEGGAAGASPPPGLHTFLSSPVPVPALQFESAQGREDVRATQGGAILINLWSSSCVPCLAELKDFAVHADEVRAAGLDVLALSVDQLVAGEVASTAKEESAKAIASTGFPFRSGFAYPSTLTKLQIINDTVFDLHETLPVPTSFLLDESGFCRAIYKGLVPVDRLLVDVKRLGVKGEASRAASLPFEGRWAAPYRKIHYIPIAMRLAEAGFSDEARAVLVEFQKMMLAHPDAPRLLNLTGKGFEREGRYAEALEMHEAAVALPTCPPRSRAILADLLATAPVAEIRDGRRAVEIAEAAAGATEYADPEVLSALAAAYGEDGFFLQAAKFAKDAEALARDNGLDAIADEAVLRLRVFEEKRAYRRE